MKKFLKIIGIIVLLLIVFVLVAGLFVSKTYHLEKDITINAPREKVWSYVGTFAGHQKWSPWLDADPAAQTSVEGTDGTVGAVYKWKGNKEVGAGSQTLQKVDKPSKVETHLNFKEPFEGEADAFINLSDVPGGTKATWSFDTKYAYPMNVMLLFVNMDKMMGEQYDKGLSRLKKLSETN